MGIYTAVTRMTSEGTPSGGWYPKNGSRWRPPCVTTPRDGAYANFAEDIRGTLSVGKLADFVALSEDILTIPPEQTLRTKVLLKVMGGKDTYRSAEF
jgi:predicted amidohydrolase YtcJ